MSSSETRSVYVTLQKKVSSKSSTRNMVRKLVVPVPFLFSANPP